MTAVTGKKGVVYLVGCGPGDASLLTLKGFDIIQRADVVVYDRLIPDEILKKLPREVERLYVGKESGMHTLSQDEINALLVKKARIGSVVVRLKGGDPFIFGRGGEEALALRREGISFEVVPGITAGLAASAYAGIPLTHRTVSSSVTLLTGHEDPQKNTSDINWKVLARDTGTLVVYMGVKNLQGIVEQLISNGKNPETPSAVIQWGTMPEQKVAVAPLGKIVKEAEKCSINPPAVVVVGDVVHLRKKLSWFEHQPLFGKRILVTRTRQQSSEIVALLRGSGAKVVECPTIAVESPDNWDEIDSIVSDFHSYKWIVFTSANGVEFFFQRLRELKMDARIFGDTKICAIGPATARSLLCNGLIADLVPECFVAESVVESFRHISKDNGRTILLLRSDRGRDVLPDGLSNLGFTVREVAVYRNVAVTLPDRTILDDLVNGRIDLVTFASASAVERFCELLSGQEIDVIASRIPAAVIGPVTAEAAQHAGFTVAVEPSRYTIPDMIEGIIGYFADHK